MDEMKKNKMDKQELDKASGGKISPWHPKAFYPYGNKSNVVHVKKTPI